MTCETCTKATINPQHRLFSPACPYCGARMIQTLGTLHISSTECATRRRQVLTDWQAFGHDPLLLRELAKGPTAIAPAK